MNNTIICDNDMYYIQNTYYISFIYLCVSLSMFLYITTIATKINKINNHLVINPSLPPYRETEPRPSEEI